MSGSPTLPAPRFLDAGEAALVVEFGRTVDPAINDRVLALDAALAARSIEGVRECVPTYRSLMIHYEPLYIGRAALVRAVEDRLADHAVHRPGSASWTVPCCYEPPVGEDLAEMAALAGLPVDAAASLHAQAVYRVYMCGFAPGFAYLGGLPERISVSRREKPRPPHPAKSVLVGGGLSAISTVAMPTGWYVVGRTPERLYAPDRPDRPFLMDAGDTVRFEAVDAATFEALDRRAEAGEVISRSVTA